MDKMFFLFLSLTLTTALAQPVAPATDRSSATHTFCDAADFGFSPAASGLENVTALQKAVDKGGTITVSQPGNYKIAGTVYIGDNTTLDFGNGVFLEKSAEKGAFTHVLLNKGALTRTYNTNIAIIGLSLAVNGVDKRMDAIFGLRGHIAFFYVKHLRIEHFRCTGLVNGQFAIQVCTFEDLLINDGFLGGKKDGIHLGPGRRFKISNVVFQTGDDAIALVPGDWVTSNPEFGDLEDGVVENCSDIPDDYLEGAFAKIVASAWTDWQPGMKVRHGDAVVSNGKIYRVLAKIDGQQYTSLTAPAFAAGTQELDGINWLMFQTGTIHTAVVRNVVFRDIFLHSFRTPFQLVCYSVDYAHSYYPGAPLPVQGGITLENVQVLNEKKRALVSISSPCDVLTIRDTSFMENGIDFNPSADIAHYPPTKLNLAGCVFNSSNVLTLVNNRCPGKEIYLKTTGSTEMQENFSAKVEPGSGKIYVDSDLIGLKR